jgi:hypothetical protein
VHLNSRPESLNTCTHDTCTIPDVCFKRFVSSAKRYPSNRCPLKLALFANGCRPQPHPVHFDMDNSSETQYLPSLCMSTLRCSLLGPPCLPIPSPSDPPTHRIKDVKRRKTLQSCNPPPPSPIPATPLPTVRPTPHPPATLPPPVSICSVSASVRVGSGGRRRCYCMIAF